MGPSTAPMVVAQTTSEIARARRPGSARSAAANRDWRLAQDEAPKAAMPASSRAKCSSTAPATTTPAPAAPIR